MKEFSDIHEFISHYKHVNGGYFFDRDTLKIFGERISEMKVYPGTYTVESLSGEKHTAYKISTRQRKHPDGPRCVYKYFDVETMRYVIL